MKGRGKGDRASESVHRLCREMLHAAARLVPRPERRAWLGEWEGELWALWTGGWSAGALVRYAVDGARSAAVLRWEETMKGWTDDVRYGLRGLARSPGLAVVAVVVLALGVGANTAIFSVLHDALIRGAPYPDADELVVVDLVMGDSERALAGEVVEGVNRLPFSYPKYRLLEDAVETVRLAGYTSRSMTLLDAGDPARVPVEIVTPSYFDVLGGRAALGRTFPAGEAEAGAGAVAVLAHALWTTRFGGDPDVLGRTVRVNGTPVTVIGVMPSDFPGLTGEASLWVPMSLAPSVMDPRRLERVWSHWFFAVGRLAEGVAAETADADVARAGRVLDEEWPAGEGSATGADVRSFTEARVNPEARLSVVVLSGAALLLLLIACANVAGLLVARAQARRRELSVLAALGAPRGRVVRSRLTESFAVAALGGLVGVVLARWGVDALAAGLPRAVGTSGENRLLFLDASRISLDVPALLFALAATLLTGLLAGAWPAWRGSRGDPAGALSGSRGETGAGGRGSIRARAVLVGSQLALALVLLSGAGLMLRSLAGLQSVDLGFDPRGVLVASWEMPREAGPEEALAFHAELSSRLARLPGVEAVSAGQCAPLSGACDVTMVTHLDGTEVDGEVQVPAATHFVEVDYFRAAGIPVRSGRAFAPSDDGGAPLVAVVSETAARRLFPDGSALGRRLSVSVGPFAEAAGAEIVGVVGDARHDSRLDADPLPSVYVPVRQSPVGYMTLLLRTSGADPARLAGEVRREALALRPDVPLYDVSTLEDRVAAVTARTRVVLLLLGAFAVTAVLLSAVGLYGLVTHAVSRRTREMGVRMALGARAGRVVGEVLGRSLVVVAAGLAAGLAASWLLTRVMAGLLFEVAPRDVPTLAAAAGVLALTALAAAWLPARRAAAVDPAESLRTE